MTFVLIISVLGGLYLFFPKFHQMTNAAFKAVYDGYVAIQERRKRKLEEQKHRVHLEGLEYVAAKPTPALAKPELDKIDVFYSLPRRRAKAWRLSRIPPAGFSSIWARKKPAPF